jgi:hypothetical protein
MSLSRQEILNRIRSSRRVTYGKTPADRVGQPSINKIDTSQDIKKFVPDWGTRKDDKPEASKIDKHEKIYDYFIKKFGQHNSDQLINHLNTFFDKHKMNRDYIDHMKDADYKFENKSHDWSARMVSRNCQLQTTDREVLDQMAKFLEKSGKTEEFKKYMESVRPESQDETQKS